MTIAKNDEHTQLSRKHSHKPIGTFSGEDSWHTDWVEVALHAHNGKTGYLLYITHIVHPPQQHRFGFVWVPPRV